MFNVVTIAREYGSGGADIGRKVADLLGWECIDKQIIEHATQQEKVDRSWAESADERSYAWWERVMYGFRNGDPSMDLGATTPLPVDYDLMQKMTASFIQQAANTGKCVIIGRSSQCILRRHPHVLHVAIYAPLTEKLERMKIRHPHEKDLRGLLEKRDADRARYIQTYYKCDGQNHRLYHLCLNSTMGI
ncbi:MAG: cytidylate kinase-like family protein, partial [Acidobacteriaceae bacterium]|nr:cytidylate kinase-like family protein [Acidobacteriaceae bacterium]